MSFRKSFGIDIKSANEGVWVKYAGDIEFKIKYCKNKDTKKAMFDYLKKHNVLDITQLDTDSIIGLSPLLLTTILVDWKGVKDDEGKEIPFSKQNVEDLLFEKQEGEYIFIKVLEFIQKQSENSNLFSIGYVEKRLKN